MDSFADRFDHLRAYTVTGVRPDSDFFLWKITERFDDLLELGAALNGTPFAGWLETPYSYVATTKASQYTSARKALDSDKVRHRVEFGVRNEVRPGGFHLLGKAVGGRAEHPGNPALLSDGYRTVTVFHGRVGLSPRAGRLTQLESRLMRQSGGPRATEEGQLVSLQKEALYRSLECVPCVDCQRLDVLAE